jgi:2-dehydropantoate 2-reductase
VRFVVFGAGAVGGLIGGRLLQYGNEVVFIARGAHARRMRDVGLRIDSPDGAALLPVNVVEKTDDLKFRSDDVVLLAVKSQDTAEALRSLVPVTPESIAITCMQNGVENERSALRLFRNVYGAYIQCPATHLEAGVIAAHSSPVTGIADIGRFPSGSDALAESIVAVLGAATFSSKARDDISRWKYTKLLSSLGHGVQAVCGDDARRGDLGRGVKDEGIACLRAAGIEFAGEAEDARRRDGVLHWSAAGGPGRAGTSSWQSLARATGSIETDFLNGEIVLLGRLAGVNTPLNATTQYYANRLARLRLPPGSVSQEEFMETARRSFGAQTVLRGSSPGEEGLATSPASASDS